MKAYRWSRVIAPLIFNRGTRWTCVVNFTSGPLYLREGIPVAVNIEGCLSFGAGVDGFRREKNPLPLL
jgi:hypothetical protein